MLTEHFQSEVDRPVHYPFHCIWLLTTFRHKDVFHTISCATVLPEARGQSAPQHFKSETLSESTNRARRKAKNLPLLKFRNPFPNTLFTKGWGFLSKFISGWPSGLTLPIDSHEQSFILYLKQINCTREFSGDAPVTFTSC